MSQKITKGDLFSRTRSENFQYTQQYQDFTDKKKTRDIINIQDHDSTVDNDSVMMDPLDGGEISTKSKKAEEIYGAKPKTLGKLQKKRDNLKKNNRDSDESLNEIDHLRDSHSSLVDSHVNTKHKSIVEYDGLNLELRTNEAPNLILYKYRWVVLITFAMACMSIGCLIGSMNVAIVYRIGESSKTQPKMVRGDLDWCRYSDLVLYFPMSYLSVFIVEKYGMRACIVIGCFVMIAGSLIRVVVYLGGTIWWWYFGHIVSVASGSLIRTSTSKLASNWFGDKERGFATAVGICSVPFGIFISKILTLVMFDD